MKNTSIRVAKLIISIILAAFCLNAFAAITDKWTVLITGGTREIGKEIAQKFDDKG